MLKRANKKSGAVLGETGRSEVGTSKLANGTEVASPIDNDHIMSHKPHKEFKLKLSVPPKSEGDAKATAESEDDYYEDFLPSADDDGVTPLSKVNGTSVTVADVLLHDEKILLGDSTFTKKCDPLGHCFVAKCMHAEFDDSRRRFCTIYKNLHLPGTELLNNNQVGWKDSAAMLHLASATVAVAALYSI